MTTNNEIMKQYRLEHKIPNDTPMLTYGIWRRNGYTVKKGEHAHAIKMWATTRHIEGFREKPCYMRTVYLFDETQVEKAK